MASSPPNPLCTVGERQGCPLYPPLHSFVREALLVWLSHRGHGIAIPGAGRLVCSTHATLGLMCIIIALAQNKLARIAGIICKRRQSANLNILLIHAEDNIAWVLQRTYIQQHGMPQGIELNQRSPDVTASRHPDTTRVQPTAKGRRRAMESAGNLASIRHMYACMEKSLLMLPASIAAVA